MGRHVTCCVQCLSGECSKRTVDVRLDTLPQDQPWSVVGWCFVCEACGYAGSVNITPNWHDMPERKAPFTPGWECDELTALRELRLGSGQGHWQNQLKTLRVKYRHYPDQAGRPMRNATAMPARRETIAPVHHQPEEGRVKKQPDHA